MGRSFPFDFRERKLAVVVICVDEGWELWVAEGDRRLARGACVSVDEATEAGRLGEDRIRAVAEQVKVQVLDTQLALEGGIAPLVAG